MSSSYPFREAAALLFTVLVLLLSLSIVVAAGVQAAEAPELEHTDRDRAVTVTDLDRDADRAVTSIGENHDVFQENDSDGDGPIDVDTPTNPLDQDGGDGESENSSDGEGDDGEQGVEGESEPGQLADQIGDLNVHTYEFTEDDNGEPILLVEVTWTGRSPETMTITQLPGRDGNRIAISRNRIPPDEKYVVQVDLVADDQPALLYTDQSLDNERAIVLRPDRNTSRETTLVRGTAIGILVGLLGTVGAVWRHYNIEDDPEQGAW